MEEHISSALEGVKDRLPALAMYQEIYGYDNEIETDLQKRILLAYLAFMDLAIEIVEYYAGPSHREYSHIQLRSTIVALQLTMKLNIRPMECGAVQTQ